MQELPAEKRTDVAILIVDDSAPLVQSLTYALTNEGYGVESRRDGQQGWDRLVAAAERKAGMPDLLLLDLNMPGMDGLTLLRRLRADERFALLPVVILTGETDTETRFEALEAGANDYLPKPVQAVELLARVKSIVGWKLAERFQQRRMERLIEAGRILLSTIDLDRVLDRVMQITTIEMDTEDASIWLQDTDGSLECRAAFGKASDRLMGMRMTPGQGIAGWALKNKQSVLVADAQVDPRFFRRSDQQVGFHTRDIVTVPLLVRGYSVGVLQAVNKRNGTFSPADLAWMEVLAPMAAAAIASARLFDALQQRTDQLQQRTDELQARNEELDAFAHTVAHDLKAPVTGIVGYATMLEEACTELPEETLRELLREVAQGANKMSRIIEELLLLAGVRKREVEMGPLDMATIVREALQRLVGVIEEHHAKVAVPRSWPVALGYGPWVEEVWANYISNAIKYGGRPPRLELGATPQSDGRIRFWLRDNGAGLSEEDQARLFVPFTKLDQIRVEGHGLGLSIVRRIMEKLGGEAGVESKLGQGSVFSFTLPAAPGGA
jgi:signal transduction histidine kinase/DNA-binding response OmpR family regulator